MGEDEKASQLANGCPNHEAKWHQALAPRYLFDRLLNQTKRRMPSPTGFAGYTVCLSSP